MNLKKAVNVSHFFIHEKMRHVQFVCTEKFENKRKKKIPKEKMKHSLSNLVNKIEEFIAINHFNLSITTLLPIFITLHFFLFLVY